MKKILIDYYSGTGGTALIANRFAKFFQDKGCQADVNEIRYGISPESSEYDLLLILYPVHAGNAPEGVYTWIHKMRPVKKIASAVISVSGGGEMIFNTACRVRVIQKLESLGYDVFYENMLVMPNNFVFEMKSPLPELILLTLPQHIMMMAGHILSGQKKRIAPLFADRFLSRIGEMEKLFTKLFGKKIYVTAACAGCGWCADHCPAGNIAMEAGKPVFKNRCQLCMKCLYGCPQQSLLPGVLKSSVLKDGYPLEMWQKSKVDICMFNLDKIAKGFVYSGVRKYLKEFF